MREGAGLVLVIEDDPLQAAVAMQVIVRGNPGVEVQLATNGFHALMNLSERRPDVMVVDLDLPSINGAETLRIVQRDPQRMSIPTLVTSALDEEDMQSFGELPDHVQVMSKSAVQKDPELLAGFVRRALRAGG